LKGHPQIENRAALYRSDGRLSQWLQLIEQYGPSKGRVIEVGCAPGVLLQELRDRDYECIGVEISDDVAKWTSQAIQVDVRSGFFPDVDLPPCHLFLAFDVLEHSPCPRDFMRHVSQLIYLMIWSTCFFLLTTRWKF
jgi:2-polyprenyl-3-methyl-5-hydroxy-6-metoxy-1,4-benzoquinol methylase